MYGDANNTAKVDMTVKTADSIRKNRSKARAIVLNSISKFASRFFFSSAVGLTFSII
jgi:hypothetical protein